MNLLFENLVFPFHETNLERIIEENYFKINLRNGAQEIRIHLNNEMMLLEFSKSLKATCGYVKDLETESYIHASIDLHDFIAQFNARYKMEATVSSL